MLKICEIYKSIQGESSFAGYPCAFIRLHGCNLKCAFCDTVYAREGDYSEYNIEEAAAEAWSMGCNSVEVTGGEPLIQKETPALCKILIESGMRVLVETNGTQNIDTLPHRCIRIVDVKCPGSGEGGSFLIENISNLRPSDEVKFVISDKYDFDWAVRFDTKYDLEKKCCVVIAPAFGIVSAEKLAGWILESGKEIRLGFQLHKYIWGEKARGL